MEFWHLLIFRNIAGNFLVFSFVLYIKVHIWKVKCIKIHTVVFKLTVCRPCNWQLSG